MQASSSISRFKSLLQGLVSSRHQSIRAKFIELLLLSLFVPVLGSLLFSHDPLGLDSGFAWAALLPVLFAARYGAAWGFAAACLSAASFLLVSPVYTGQHQQLVTLALGTAILAVLTGDITTAWSRRTAHAEAENRYLRHRLKEFSNDYHVLKVSHGQLEEYMAGQRMSLRYALQQLKPMLSSTPAGLEAGSELMAVFAQFCSIQVAGLYAMQSPERINPAAVATHGEMSELPQFDQLLNLAIKKRQLVSVKIDSLATDDHPGSLLAVVPIVDSHDHLHGVLAIRDMHFMAFQQENLNILSLLGRYVGDMLTRSQGVGESQGSRFVAELDTALCYSRAHGIQSSIVCIKLREIPQRAAIAELISSNLRSLDSAWFPPCAAGHFTVVVLLPLIAEERCTAYLNRVIQLVENEFRVDKSKWFAGVSVHQIAPVDSHKSCLQFINRSAQLNAVVGVADDAGEERTRSVA